MYRQGWGGAIICGWERSDGDVKEVDDRAANDGKAYTSDNH